MVKKKRQSLDAHDESSSTDSSDERPLQSPTAIAANGGCQHVKKAVDTQRLRKQLKATGLAVECMQCTKSGNTTGVVSPASEASEEMDNLGFEYDNTLWLCLKCGTQLCGRSKNQHALQHYKTPHSDSHALTMNTRSFEIWCYDCNNEVVANSRKNLLECVEVVKKLAQKPMPPTPTTLINNIQQGLAHINAVNNMVTPLIPTAPPIPGMAKRVNEAIKNTTTKNNISKNVIPLGPIPLKSLSLNLNIEQLPRVRGLTNLGNTCFFNAVMQCLAQTPYLLDVLKESAELGEKFILPGGTFKFKDNENVELPMIEGTLSGWGGLTSALAQALEELQTGGGVFTPSKLFDKLCNKCPQFRGGDQHDSHELLRHLLESVRSEDLKRYQRVILQNLGYKDQDINSVSEEMRQKCKIYGNQAADRILRPEQVFRGFLVSTLTCQDCYNVSSRHEYFLDMSLPVSVEKPQPPQRHRSSPENSPASSSTASFYLNPAPAGPTKSQLKKEKEKERKAKRAAKHKNNKLGQKLLLEDVTGASGDAVAGGADAAVPMIGCPTREEAAELSSCASSNEESDADVEDNLIDDNASLATHPPAYDANGNDTLLSPNGKPEKRDDSPENIDKDSLDEDENDSGIATSPANGGSFPSSEQNGTDLTSLTSTANAITTNNSVVSMGLSEKGANFVRQLSMSNDINSITETIDSGMSSAAKVILTNGIDQSGNEDNEMKKTAQALTKKLDEMQLNDAQQKAAARKRAQRVRTQSYSDWSTTIAPRYQCEDGECSIQSCLNNFTAVELMTGNNKVGCEKCTQRINGDDPKAKTVNTNATKQFLISSPPAVLILHLKRFQLGPRCMFRKLTRAVSFNTILDIAPFCGSKVKNLPNIDRKQKKLLYALYGVVEHSGGMYGGHYTAYVKVRAKLANDDKRWKFIPQGSKAELEQDDEQRKKLEELLAKEKARDMRLKAADDSDDFSNGSTTTGSSCSSSSSASEQEETPNECIKSDEGANVTVPPGKWYYVSDSLVREVNEDEVLRAQAYLLFYERIY